MMPQNCLLTLIHMDIERKRGKVNNDNKIFIYVLSVLTQRSFCGPNLQVSPAKATSGEESSHTIFTGQTPRYSSKECSGKAAVEAREVSL